MKKNTMMRLASILLVCVLLTTSVISGTYAKYITTGSSSDSARVAKWGVTVNAAAEGAFGTKYETDDTNTTFKFTGAHSVEAATDDNNNQDDVVAPGTSGDINFSIAGTTEVATNVDVSFGDISMITLPADKVVITEATDEEEAIFNEIYNPIKWTLKLSNEEVEDSEDWEDVAVVAVNGSELKGVTLEAIQSYFEDVEADDKNFAPNTDLAEAFGYYRLSWEWAYEGSETGVDIMDTFLAQQTSAADGIVLTESFDLSITVTQID